MKKKNSTVAPAGLFPAFRVQALILLAAGLILYGNTVMNRYALDDGIVMEKNEYVHNGFAGIGDIMTKDAYDSFYRQMNAKDQLKGGRYRPLSIVTFAMEYQFFGFHKGDKVSFTANTGDVINGEVARFEKSGEVSVRYDDAQAGKTTIKVPLERIHQFSRLTFVQHAVNVLLFIGSVILLLYFLSRYFFKGVKYGELLSFITAFLFLVHPIHTEVIANVKSRDEILSFLFIIATLIYVYRSIERPSFKCGVMTGVMFLLALLSKEYAAILLVLVPMILWAQSARVKKDLVYTVLPMVIVLFIYVPLRMEASVFTVDANVKKDVLNDPYLFATKEQALATKIFVPLQYIRLLILPAPLASDYSYQHFAYRDFGDAGVWLSILVHLLIIAGTLYAFLKKHWLFFAGAFYLGNLALVSNLVLDIGATMGERLIYHSSLGFCLLAAFALVKLLSMVRDEKKMTYAAGGMLLCILVPSGYLTIKRNAQWYNDTTLFLHDVKVHPNSAMLNGNAGSRLISLSELPENREKADSLLQQSVQYSRKAISLHPEYVNAYINLGLAEFMLKNYDESEAAFRKAREIFPSHPVMPVYFSLLSNHYLNEGIAKGTTEKKYDEAVALMQKAAELSPQDPEIYYNMGGAYFTAGNYEKAREMWNRTLQLRPDHTEARRGLGALPPAIP